MAHYTVELRHLENRPLSRVFDFDYSYYLKGLVSEEVYEQKKNEFETKFINNYFFDEIGFDTPDRFKQRLKNYLDKGFKIWHERYKTELEVEKQNINFMLNKDLIEERVTEGNGSATATSQTNTTSNTIGKGNNKSTVNDTPDTRFGNNTDGFATSITTDESNNSADTTSAGTSTNESNQTSKATDKFISKGNIGITSSAELLEKWREVLIDVDNEIIDGADGLFMQIL